MLIGIDIQQYDFYEIVDAAARGEAGYNGIFAGDRRLEFVKIDVVVAGWGRRVLI